MRFEGASIIETCRRARARAADTAAATVLATALGMIWWLPTHAASAATTATWDRLAHCETDGQWAANYGNNYYGGLQLSMEFWQAYGGLQYAPRPDLAGRPEQILVAQRLADEASWKPWPICSHRLHLTNEESMGAPDVTPAPTDAPTPVPTDETSPPPGATPE